MKAALIPPIPELARYGTGDFHLLLSHLLSNPQYLTHYTVQRRRGAYIVLDNSAHEFNAGAGAKILRDQALVLRAQEVVVPDVLADRDMTTLRATNTLEVWYEDSDTRMLELNPSLMYVPQGKCTQEWVDCLYELVRIHSYVVRRTRGMRASFVIGISKDYDDDEQYPGGLAHLLRDYVNPLRVALYAKFGIKMQVHLLGWIRNLWGLTHLVQEFPWLRSTDSAKPFVYARVGVALNTAHRIPPYPRRQDDYFERPLLRNERSLATRNVKTYQRLAAA